MKENISLSDLMKRVLNAYDEVLGTDELLGIQDRQVLPLERMLLHLGYESAPPLFITEEDRRNNRRPVQNMSIGRIGYTYLNAGYLSLGIAKPEENNLQGIFFQYTHRPRLEKSPISDNLEYYNDGVANVFMTEEGIIYGMVMFPNEDYAIFQPWRPSEIKMIGKDYPDSAMEALNIVRTSAMEAQTSIPFSPKLAMLMLLAADTYSGVERDYMEAEKEILIIGGNIEHHKITKEGLSTELADFFGVEEGQHPLKDLVNEELIPPDIDVVIVDDYMKLLVNLIEGGFPLPNFFRSSDRGLYTSVFAPWDNPGASFGFREILGFHGLDFDRAIILPSEAPDTHYAWDAPWEILKHHSLLQVFEELPTDKMQYLFDFYEECVPQVKQLLNPSYSGVRVPDKDDKTSPYSFTKYSPKEQARILGAFLAGVMTIGKPIHRYWSSEPVWGDGTDQWHHLPELIQEILAEAGFKIENAPEKTIYPFFMRPSGSVTEEWAWPTANDSTVFTMMDGFLSDFFRTSYEYEESDDESERQLIVVELDGREFVYRRNGKGYHLKGVDLEMTVMEVLPTIMGGKKYVPIGEARATAINPWAIDAPEIKFRNAFLYPVEGDNIVQKLNQHFWETFIQGAPELGFEKVFMNLDKDSKEYELALSLGFIDHKTEIAGYNVNLVYEIESPQDPAKEYYELLEECKPVVIEHLPKLDDRVDSLIPSIENQITEDNYKELLQEGAKVIKYRLHSGEPVPDKTYQVRIKKTHSATRYDFIDEEGRKLGLGLRDMGILPYSSTVSRPSVEINGQILEGPPPKNPYAGRYNPYSAIGLTSD